MVDLSQIELASEEDKAYEIDRWARLFKARTWEELRMIAKNDPNLQQASNDLYVINAEKIHASAGEGSRRRNRACWSKNHKILNAVLERTFPYKSMPRLRAEACVIFCISEV